MDDNTTENRIDTSRVITWQYDKAEMFLNFLEAKEDVANMVVGDSWNTHYSEIFDLLSCGEFGLWLWGILLGISRPVIENENGVKTPISDDAYRRVLRARLYWMFAEPSMIAAAHYFALLLNCGKDSSYPYRIAKITDNLDMTVEVELNWLPNLEEQTILQTQNIIPHPTGVEVSILFPDTTEYLGFEGYWSEATTLGGVAMRIGLGVTVKTYWGYYISGSSGDMIIPPDPYYKSDGTALMYDSENNEYYLEEGGERVVYGKDSSHKMYDSNDATTRHELIEIDDGAFYYVPDGMNYKKTVTKPYDSSSLTSAHELTHDANGWYYQVGSVKYYYKGQSLSNFDNGIFGTNQESS